MHKSIDFALNKIPLVQPQRIKVARKRKNWTDPVERKKKARNLKGIWLKVF